MNGKDLFLGMNYVSAKYIDEAETAMKLKGEYKRIPFRKVLWIAAVIALLAATITACAFAIQRIRMNLVQHNIPSQSVMSGTEQPEETHPADVLTDCYPQFIPEGYSILCGSPTSHTARGIVYRNENGKTIHFQISIMSIEDDIVLKPPVAESEVVLGCGEAVLRTNEGAQVLIWKNEEEGYDASLFTDDLEVELPSMADGVGFGKSIPLSVWYHRGQEWEPWYPQVLPDGYTCTDVSPVIYGYQSFTFTNGSCSIRYGISTEEDLTPPQISGDDYWEDTEVNGVSAKILRNKTTQRTLFWNNEEEGFSAFLETMDESVDLTALAESTGPGEKMEVSPNYLGPDYTIELEQDQTTYIEWRSIYPQVIPAGYELENVGDRAYGQQTITWKNEAGDTISFTLYFRLGKYGREFDGSGQPEAVSIHGHSGYRTENKLLWTDEEMGFAYELHTTGSIDLIALAESVGPGPELPFTNDQTHRALAQLGDYRITALPDNMVEDGLSGSPLEGEDDWYSYVRRWYYDRTNNGQVYFTYETYLTECTTEEDVLRLFVSGTSEPEFVTIHGYPGITLQDGDRAYVAWMVGDVNKGISFQLTSEQFTVAELLQMAESVQKQ